MSIYKHFPETVLLNKINRDHSPISFDRRARGCCFISANLVDAWIVYVASVVLVIIVE